MMIRQLFITILSIFIFIISSQASAFNLLSKEKSANTWVDSIFNTLDIDGQIAQLLMYPAYSNKDIKHESIIQQLIKDNKIGGLIFMQGSPSKQVELINKYQSISSIPLFIAMDAEWSISMRLDSTIIYPRQMMLGAIQDDNLIYRMGKEFARQLKRVGVHINFAPCVDINNNPNNPVINDRSFGEDKHNVAIKSEIYMRALQDNGIIACAKHFPGHGDTDIDSHISLAKNKHNKHRLDTLELFPYRYLIDKGLKSIMTGHIEVPAFEDQVGLPASLSEKIIKQLLKQDLDFKGLIFTDAMNMGGITQRFKPGEAEVMALIADNDIILFPNDINIVIDSIKKAINDGRLSKEKIEKSCKKVLKAKYYAGLNNLTPLCSINVVKDINNIEAQLLQQDLIAKSLTLIANKDNILPIKHLDKVKIASISFGSKEISYFQERLTYYSNIQNFIYNNFQDKKTLIDSLLQYDIIIASIHNTKRQAKDNYGISPDIIQFIDQLSETKKIILDLFANPYSLDLFTKTNNYQAIIISYNDWKLTNDLSAQLIFGGIPALGRLPVSIGDKFSPLIGEDTEKTRLGYSTIAESVKVNSSYLYKIDSIITDALSQEAFPGVQVLAAKDGFVFFQKNYGFHDYTQQKAVSDFDIYDIASLTKVIGTTNALMQLYDENKYNLNDELSKHLIFLQNTNKERYKIKDILTHRAGFKSWIPFYKSTIATDSTKAIYYSTTFSPQHNIKVADNLYVLSSYKDTIYKRIIESPNNALGKYVYSDLGFYLFPLLIEKYSSLSFSDYLKSNFYKPLGASTITFNPLNYFSISQIIPTELDQLFRNQQLHGYVHDQGAALMGGISGHAGLFSNANDLAKILQMLLYYGKYGNKQYIKEETIKLFTKYQFTPSHNRRALGWDKANPKDRTKGSGSESASKLAFGHNGYTGTMVWVDPEYNMIFIFLSNRVNPSADNTKLMKLNIRTQIEEVIYQSILNYENTN